MNLLCLAAVVAGLILHGHSWLVLLLAVPEGDLHRGTIHSDVDRQRHRGKRTAQRVPAENTGPGDVRLAAAFVDDIDPGEAVQCSAGGAVDHDSLRCQGEVAKDDSG